MIFMEIKDVKPNQGNIKVEVDVIKKDSPRQFEKFGKTGKVCNAVVQDASGEITLTLWNDDVDKVNVGDKIKLDNGWCSEYKGERQLSAGKFGKIEVVGKAEIGKESGAKSSPAAKSAAATTIFTNDPSKLKQAASLDDDGDDDDADGDDEDETEEFDDEEVVE